jgi:hypothetical protein
LVNLGQSGADNCPVLGACDRSTPQRPPEVFKPDSPA